jgi:nitrogen fixation-related uncharacterized protein
MSLTILLPVSLAGAVMLLLFFWNGVAVGLL